MRIQSHQSLHYAHLTVFIWIASFIKFDPLGEPAHEGSFRALRGSLVTIAYAAAQRVKQYTLHGVWSNQIQRLDEVIDANGWLLTKTGVGVLRGHNITQEKALSLVVLGRFWTCRWLWIRHRVYHYFRIITTFRIVRRALVRGIALGLLSAGCSEKEVPTRRVCLLGLLVRSLRWFLAECWSWVHTQTLTSFK